MKCQTEFQNLLFHKIEWKIIFKIYITIHYEQELNFLQSAHVSLFPCVSFHLDTTRPFLNNRLGPKGPHGPLCDCPAKLMPIMPLHICLCQELGDLEDLNPMNHILFTLHISWHSRGMKWMFDRGRGKPETKPELETLDKSKNQKSDNSHYLNPHTRQKLIRKQWTGLLQASQREATGRWLESWLLKWCLPHQL